MIAALRERVRPDSDPALDELILALGEQADARRLRDALMLGQGFELHLVACATPRVGRALLAWLASELTRAGSGLQLERIVARLPAGDAALQGPELAEQILTALTAPAGPELARVVDATRARSVDVPAWEWCLRRLNERRNLVAASAPAPLTLLLPPHLERRLAFGAPDLWSIRSVDIAVGEVPGTSAPVGRGPELAPRVLDGDTPEALREELRTLDEAEGPHATRARLVLLGRLAHAASRRGDVALAERVIRDEWLPSAEAAGAEGEVAAAQAELATLRWMQGDGDLALELLRQAVAAYERLGDVRSRAVTMGQIADILAARGDLDESLRILREDLSPVFERLGDVRSRAVTMGKIADILASRGDLDEALRIRREEELPVYERLGDVRSRAVTMGKIADILADRGDLDEALRIRRVEELPVYERLGDVRSRAVTMGKIADILAARGDLDLALRIRREEELPIYERLGGRDLCVGLANLAIVLFERDAPGDAAEARRLVTRATAMADQMHLPFPAWLRRRLDADGDR